MPGLTLPLLPALLSGVFQTPGASQEPPGLALLCPLLRPVHAGTQSFVSSQQQLQEDEIAAGGPAALLDSLLYELLSSLLAFIVKFHRNGAGFFCFYPATPQFGHVTFRPGPSQTLQSWSLCRWLITSPQLPDFSDSVPFVDFVGMSDASVHLFFPSSAVFDPFASFCASVDDWTSVFALTRALCVLQVLKPLSEHYMEDNVRQTVVNSIKASLTEQASQRTKLKTH